MTHKTVSQFSQPSVLVRCHNRNAENPLWHPQHKCIYWSDIPEGKLFRFFPNKDQHECVHSGEPIGGFTIQSDGSLLLFRTKGTVEIWQEEKIATVISEIPEAIETRFNDVIADPKGRVFAGTMGAGGVDGNLYRIDLDGSYQRVVEGLVIPNGMAFSDDYRTFYMTESHKRVIYKFDYDVESGRLSNQKVHIQVPENEGIPDGMTIDAEKYLWSARWDGSAVYRYDPEGKEIMKIELPVARVSSITFGGEGYRQIFISSAKLDDAPETKNMKQEDMAGNIFSLDSTVSGRPELLSKVLI